MLIKYLRWISSYQGVKTERRAKRLIVILLTIFLLCVVYLISTPHVAFSLRPAPDLPDFDGLDTFEDFGTIPKPRVQVSLALNGLPLRNSEIEIDASNAKMIVPASPVINLGSTVVYPLAAGQFQWELISKPSGSVAELSETSTLTPKLLLDRTGEYIVRFTGCPEGCLLLPIGGGTLTVPELREEITIIAVDQLVLPPGTVPSPPSQPATTATRFDDFDGKCQFAPDLVNPQWVTVNHWGGPEDYELLEGRVTKSRTASSDNILNHDSMDFLSFVLPDPKYRRLLAGPPLPFQTTVEVEWERDHYPEVFRPTRGDRVAFMGYWIHDCGHGGKTEIHPPVMSVAQRARPIKLPEAEGYGSNIFIPGIISDIWINGNAGEITRNCSQTGLHQPGGGEGITLGPHLCLPQTEGFPRNPINRVYTFNIYMPLSPQLILSQAGVEAPPVPLYYDVRNPLGDPGPDPIIEVMRGGENDTTYLEVSIDLSSYTASTYSRRIFAGWVYPSPDNWDLKRWKFRLNSVDVHDDSDGKLSGGDGDWRFWINLNNGSQEWTKLFDCNGCVHGLEDFSGRPWETSAPDADRRLGPDILLFPGQQIFLHTSGFEDDLIRSDFTGQVTRLLPQAPSPSDGYSSRSVCNSGGITSGCGAYTLHYEILMGPEIGEANLSQAGQEIYDAYLIRSGDHVNTDLLIVDRKLDMNLPDNMIILPGSAPVVVADTTFFIDQLPEPAGLQDITREKFVADIEALRRQNPAALTRFVRELRQEADQILELPETSDAMIALTVLKQSLPNDLWDNYFSDIEVDDSDREPQPPLVPWWWILVAALAAAIFVALLFLIGGILFLKFRHQ